LLSILSGKEGLPGLEIQHSSLLSYSESDYGAYLLIRYESGERNFTTGLLGYLSGFAVRDDMRGVRDDGLKTFMKLLIIHYHVV
jgi:hypothetical protein